MKEYTIELKKIKERDRFHELIIKTLPVPDYYGRNLDALHDVLADIGEETEITFLGCESFKGALPNYYKSLKRLARDAMKENKRLRIIFLE